MSDATVMLTLPTEVWEKLQGIATELGCQVDDCARQAISEFLDNWDDYIRTVQELEMGEEQRPVLKAAND
jgi:predicted DNA-binding protein